MVGVVAVDVSTGAILQIQAPSVVLAAGGASHLFARTNGTADATGDAIALAMDAWLETLEKAVRLARNEGHLDPRVDPPQLAFELNALFFGANFAWNLRHDEKAFARAERAIEQRLQSVKAFRPPRRARRRIA